METFNEQNAYEFVPFHFLVLCNKFNCQVKQFCTPQYNKTGGNVAGGGT